MRKPENAAKVAGQETAMRVSWYANEQTVAGPLRNFELRHWSSIEPFSALRLGSCRGRASNTLAAALAPRPKMT